jgi:hypothetical protein
MPLRVLEKIAALVKAGATVTGPRPTEDSGLLGYPACDDKIKTLAAQLWDNGLIHDGPTIRELLLKKNIQPDFEYSDGWIDFIHRSTPEADIYFLTNRHGHAVRSHCSFRITRGTPQLWNPIDGKTTTGLNYRLAGNRLVLPLRFDAFQSWFVLFPKHTGLTPSDMRGHSAYRHGGNFPDHHLVQELSGAWDVAFDTRWGGPAHVEFDRLRDWSTSDDPHIKYYSGKAIYTKSFDFHADTQKAVHLDLGVVKNIARVLLNGQDLGIVWTAPWQVDLSPALKKGNNELRIEVINLWPNRLIGDAALPPEERLTNTNIQFKKETALLPSGLLGPVTLLH